MGRLTQRIFLHSFCHIFSQTISADKKTLIVTGKLTPRGEKITAHFQNRQSGPRGSWIGCIKTTNQ
jgi:hypothetical protein